jgi:hypothetical protein
MSIAAQGPPKRRRRMRWILLLVLPLLVLAAPVGFWQHNRAEADRELAEAIAETDRLDPRWRFDDILADRQPIADAENAAIVVGKVGALLQPRGFGLREQDQRLFEKDSLSAVCRLIGPQIVALSVALQKHAEALKLARSLKDIRGEGRLAIEYAVVHIKTLYEPVHRCRAVMQMLQLDALLRAEEDDGDGALQSCRALLVAARSIGDEPDILAMLARANGQRLTWTPWSGYWRSARRCPRPSLMRCRNCSLEKLRHPSCSTPFAASAEGGTVPSPTCKTAR